MTKTYRDLAIRKELGVKLSNEEQRSYDYLQAKIQKYDAALKTVDATMGRHQRNVGNYALANSQLNFSVTQLAREMPAFANSVQTGFMAISNNLPMFFDEIGKLKKANVELAASGQPTKNMFTQIAGSIFSLQVLLSVGVTLLTVYGAQITEFLAGLFKVSQEQEVQINQQKIINKDRKESAKFIADESSELIGNINALRKTNAGSAERAKMIKLINSTHGTTIKNLKDEALFQKQLNNQVQSFLELKIAEYKSRRNEELINMNLKKQSKLKADILASTREELYLQLQLSNAIKNEVGGGQGLMMKDLTESVGYLSDKLKDAKENTKNLKNELAGAEKRLTTYS